MTGSARKIFDFVTWGAIGAGIFATWIAPKVIAWYFDPPVDIGVNCRAATEWSMSRLREAQLTGVLVGALLGFLLGLSYFRRKKNSTANEVQKS